jgi:hypothetical protein
MRKLLLSFLTIGLFASSYNLLAQYDPDNEGLRYRNIYGAGMSMGYYNYGSVGSRSISFPPVTAFIEFGVHENITVGPFVGFGRWSYRITGADQFNYTFGHTNAGGRGSLHLTNFINDLFGSNIDPSRTNYYLTLILGLEYRNYTDVSGSFGDFYDNTVHLMFGPTAGVRYYLGSYFAVYAEAGRGNLGFVSFGMSLRL